MKTNLNIREVSVSIKGITPLLQNRFIQADIEGKSKKRSGALSERNFEDKLYRTPEGKIYQPATHIFGALVNAGKAFQIQGKGKSTYSKLFGSSLNVMPEYILHKNPKYEAFTITANNPNSRGNKMIVTRPMFTDWELDFTIQILEDSIPVEVVEEALAYGGRYVGIGDWRPDKKGKYGQFRITKFEE